MAYAHDYMRHLAGLLESIDEKQFAEALVLLQGVKRAGRKVMLAGNGASAAIASHVAVDLTKTAGVRGLTFNEPDLITCFANDYGYEQWIAKAIEFYGDSGDAVILVSSSGRSPSVVNAAATARQMKLGVITFTGFAQDNPLKQLGAVNFWVNDGRYNFVEATHQAWLLALVDAIATEVATT